MLTDYVLPTVNAIAWAPHELGPILACASSDGKISVLSFNGACQTIYKPLPPLSFRGLNMTRLLLTTKPTDDGTWDASLFAAHNIGVNAVSWAPAIAPASLIAPANNANAANNAQPVYIKKFATGGCDNLVKIWSFNEASKTWTVEETLEGGHTDWVRDVAFAPGVGLPRTYLASAGQDKTVIIWTQDGPGQAWNKKVLNPAPYLSSSAPAGPSNPAGGAAGATTQPQEGKFPDVVWKVSWSVTGNVLAVSAGDGKVSLWKENLKGEFECVSEIGA